MIDRSIIHPSWPFPGFQVPGPSHHISTRDHAPVGDFLGHSSRPQIKELLTNPTKLTNVLAPQRKLTSQQQRSRFAVAFGYHLLSPPPNMATMLPIKLRRVTTDRLHQLAPMLRTTLASTSLRSIFQYAPTLGKYLLVLLFLVNIRSWPLAWHSEWVRLLRHPKS